MKRDMELIRKILLQIEDEYVDAAIYNLKIEDYNLATIAYHCNLLFQAGLIMDYTPLFGDGQITDFGVTGITWAGHDFLDNIRSDGTWNKTKSIIKEKGLPMTLEVVKTIASTLISSMVEGVVRGMKI